MFSLFSKGRLSVLLTLVTLSTSLIADDCCCGNRLYVGAFGGGIFSNSTNIFQQGTAYFPYIDESEDGGPLAISARGHAKGKSTGFGGFQVGYEWTQCPYYIGCSDWSITPAAEFEAFFFNHKRSGHVVNAAIQDRLEEHNFADSFKLNSRTLLVNAVFRLNSCSLCGFSPYLGLGLGATRLSVKNASSFQIEPPEADVNHFNSGRSDSTWVFTAQVKAGVSYTICEKFHLFAEYRYLYLDSGRYVLGSTIYDDHVPTSPWNVKLSNTNYNAFAIGFQYDL